METERGKEIFFLRTQSEVFDSKKSNMMKYREAVVGNENLISLLKYEFMITAFGWIPGGLGLFLRRYFYAHLFKPKARDVVFGKNVDILNPSKINIGKECLIGSDCLLWAKRDGNISIGNNVSIGRGTVIQCQSGSVEIGDNTTIGGYCNIVATKTDVKLGRYVLIASQVCIIGDAGYGENSLDVAFVNQPIGDAKGIIIEDNVWLGAGVCVVDGTNIETGSIIGAGGVVTKNIPKYVIAVGVPARVIKSRD